MPFHQTVPITELSKPLVHAVDAFCQTSIGFQTLEGNSHRDNIVTLNIMKTHAGVYVTCIVHVD